MKLQQLKLQKLQTGGRWVYLTSMSLVLSDPLRDYLSKGQRDLLEQGRYLIHDIEEHKRYDFEDYSFLVFPFAKAYEGFLKQVLLDSKLITRADYVSTHFRLGKVLSPNLQQKLGDRSVYKAVCDRVGCDVSDRVWNTWKMGRNQVFHYFPHNLRSLTLLDARETAQYIVAMMEELFLALQPESPKNR